MDRNPLDTFVGEFIRQQEELLFHAGENALANWGGDPPTTPTGAVTDGMLADMAELLSPALNRITPEEWRGILTPGLFSQIDLAEAQRDPDAPEPPPLTPERLRAMIQELAGTGLPLSAPLTRQWVYEPPMPDIQPLPAVDNLVNRMYWNSAIAPPNLLLPISMIGVGDSLHFGGTSGGDGIPELAKLAQECAVAHRGVVRDWRHRTWKKQHGHRKMDRRRAK